VSEALKTRSKSFPLNKSLGYLFRDTQRLIARRLQDKIERHGLGLGQWYVLRVLWIEDGLTQRDLGLRVGMGEPNVVTALNGLENAGLARREADSSDGRRKRVLLTPAGRRLEARLTPIVQEINDAIAEDLSAGERAQLIRLISRVRETLLRQSVS